MRLFFMIFVVFCSSMTALAQTDTDPQTAETAQTAEIAQNTQPPNAPGAQSPTHPVATTYSNGYEVRLKIHKYASFATLPLFATEFALGQSLYDNPDTGSRKAVHGALGAGIVGLFGVNTVTGVWNLWESRHDENGRKLRILHSVLMLAADGGFVAASATAPNSHRCDPDVRVGQSHPPRYCCGVDWRGHGRLFVDVI